MNKQIQLIQVSPNELAEIISENLKIQIQEFIKNYSSENPKSENDFLTRKSTAELFNVSLVTIHEWCKSGLIKPYKLGNRTYFKRSELVETLFNSNRIQP